MVYFKIQRIDSLRYKEFYVGKVNRNANDEFQTIFTSSALVPNQLIFSLKFARWHLKNQIEKYPNSTFKYRIVCQTNL